ncbi:MAG: type II secretion system F family protein [Planctomycetes bacterium]|nr:type II secretion system F family protein [Planctomycetota bacterium]
MIADATQMANIARRGELLSESAMSATSFPAFMQWMLRSGERRGSLVPTLQPVCSVYRQRAIRRVEWIKLLLPLFLTLVVGGGVVLMYALALWLPLTESMQKMGLP